MKAPTVKGAEIRAPMIGRDRAILTREAIAFLADLHRHFDRTRQDLLHRRAERQVRIDRGDMLDFLPETGSVREGSWKVGPLPTDLHDRRVEITGPTDRKMMINALNSGAQVFRFAGKALGIPVGAVKATAVIETIPAAFEMEEILYELRDHAAGLNAGRWDYIFSIIKKFRDRKEFILPDRAQVTMTVPFMRAYTNLLVRTCHRRGAHAIGGMAAFIPSRKDPESNEIALAKVREDKMREANDGFDGTWVAHPDLVPVAKPVFDGILKSKPNQVDLLREDVRVSAKDLLDVRIPGGKITQAGIEGNVNVGLQYLESWLRGVGAAAISHLMEDSATAEIAQSHQWQCVRHRERLSVER